MLFWLCLILLVSSQVHATGSGKKLSLTAKNPSLATQNGSKILAFLAANDARNAKLILQRIKLVLKRLKSIEGKSTHNLRLVRL